MSCLRGSQSKSSDAGEDVIGSLDPYERLRIGVVSSEIQADGVLQCTRAAVAAAPDLLLGECPKPTFDLVDPGGVGRREVQVEPGMAQQPTLDKRRLVRAVIVEDQMDLEVAWNLGIDAIQELAKLNRAVSPISSPMTLPLATFSAANNEVVP